MAISMTSSCTLTYLVVSKSPVTYLQVYHYTHHLTLEWASGDLNAILEWDYGTANGVAYHEFYRQSQTEISETRELPNWGTFYWSTGNTKGVSCLK
jgi:hypothetical protein